MQVRQIMDINKYIISLHLKTPGALTEELNRFPNSQPPDLISHQINFTFDYEWQKIMTSHTLLRNQVLNLTGFSS